MNKTTRRFAPPPPEILRKSHYHRNELEALEEEQAWRDGYDELDEKIAMVRLPDFRDGPCCEECYKPMAQCRCND